jgi:hypothetical protein
MWCPGASGRKGVSLRMTDVQGVSGSVTSKRRKKRNESD